MAPHRAHALLSNNYCPWPTPLGVDVSENSPVALFFYRLFYPREIAAKRTIEQSLFVPRSDHNWVITPSAKALQSFTIGLIDQDKSKNNKSPNRKYVNVSKDTHYIETADLAINLRSNLKYSIEIISFLAFAHDLIEDFDHLKNVTAEDIVKKCWKGHKSYRPLLIDKLNALTDDKELRTKDPNATEAQKKALSEARHRAQIIVANSDPTGLVAHIRACDKLSSLIRDYSVLLEGGMPFNDEKRFRRYFEQRQEVIKSIKASPRIKRWYGRLLAKVERGLKHKREHGVFRGERNDFLDPLSYVSPSTPEAPHRLGRRDLGALVI